MKNSVNTQVTNTETQVFFNQKLKEYPTLGGFKKEVQKVLTDLKEYPEDNKHQIKFYTEVETMLDHHIYNSETQENNKLIAEFMGYEIQKDPTERFFGRYKTPITKVWIKENELSFDSDWNLLMPVITKITTLDEFQNKYEFNDLFWDTFTQLDINDIYQQVVSFIKWYNENK